MDVQIILIYCLCDDLLRAMHQRTDPQSQMSDAEVMTTAIVAAMYFGGQYERARELLQEQGYIPSMLSKSQFNRRLHRLDDLFVTLFQMLGETFKQGNCESIYIIDSAPIAVCDNIRIRRSKRYQTEAYRGYQASKKRYFYGLKLHLLVTKDHQPVEFFLSPGAFSDNSALTQFDFDLPDDAWIFADKAYNSYLVEDVLAEAQLHLIPDRKRNTPRPLTPWLRSLLLHYRNQIETAFSLIERLLPKSIHAITAKGFELKVVLFTLAASINCL